MKVKRLIAALICLTVTAVLSIGCTFVTPPSIAAQPAGFDGNCGDTAVFSVTASGSGPLSYQWRWNGLDLTNSGRVSGAYSPTLVIANLQAGDHGTVSVVVGNSAGSVTSVSAVLHVRDTLDFTISWSSGDLDIGVWEPDGEVFYCGDYWYSDNGTFSDDYTSGGTEWWVMDDDHDTGIYNLKIWDWNYTGNVTVYVYHNEFLVPAQTGVFAVAAGNVYTFTDITVVREIGREILQFNVASEPIPADAVKTPHKGPSPLPFNY